MANLDDILNPELGGTTSFEGIMNMGQLKSIVEVDIYEVRLTRKIVRAVLHHLTDFLWKNQATDLGQYFCSALSRQKKVRDDILLEKLFSLQKIVK